MSDRLKAMVFEFSAMFPTVSIDAITAAVLSENGDSERVLSHMLRESNAQINQTRATERAQVKQVASILSQRELDLLELATREADENDDESDNDAAQPVPSFMDATDEQLIRANQLKYRQFEAVVRVLADSFPHVPLDDVWTAVISHKGSHIEAADHLLRFIEPVSPITVPLADRDELAPSVLPLEKPKRPPVVPIQGALRESLDAARDDAVVVNADNIPLASSSDTACVPIPADEVLARALQNEEEAAASAAIMERILRDERRFTA